MVVGSLGFSVARSVFWIVNDIMMTVLMDSWQFVQTMVNSYMITWLGLYGQSSLEKPVNNHAKDEKSNVEIKIRIQ